MRDLTKGNINKQILTFALPVFISYLFNQAYSIADTRIIGSFLGNDALAAVGSISTFNDMLSSFIIGISNGFAILTARYFGKKNNDAVRRSVGSSLTLAMVITLVCMIFSIVGLNQILSMLRVQADHRENAYSYILIIIIGLIFLCVYNVLVSSLRAIGDTFTPLIFLIISTVINIAFDLIMVGSLHMGVVGAAYATIVSQFIAMLLCFLYAWKRYPEIRLKLIDLLPQKDMVRLMLPAGLSMGFMSCLVNIGTVTLQTAINGLGTNTIVAHSATRKMSAIYMMPFSTLSTTMATFVSQNFGAGEYERIKKGIRNALIMGYSWSVIAMLLTYTVYPYFIVAITDTRITEVVDIACRYQRVDSLFFMICATITTVRNSLQGMGDHTTPIVSSGLEMLGKIILALVFTPIFGYWAVIWTEPIVWIIMVIPLLVSLFRKCTKWR